MNSPVYIIAEAGVNHNGSTELALKLIDAAAEAGADAVKFQTFKAANLVTRAAPKAGYQTQRTDATESQFDMLQALELDRSQHERLIAHARERGLDFISSPFDLDSVDLLTELRVQRLKIASGELTNSPLLLKAARTGVPVILSTGMARPGEIRTALGVLAFGYLNNDTPPSKAAFESLANTATAREILKEKVVLLHCTTEYPAPFEEVNLLAIDTLRETFGISCGFSDHTPGVAASVASIARGASVIEKHMTLDRSLPGPDHQASLDPAEFRLLVQSVREAALALGSSEKCPTASESRNLLIVRKSIVAARPIQAGEPLTEENLTTKRPGGGIPPHDFWDLLGSVADRDYETDSPIQRP